MVGGARNPHAACCVACRQARRKFIVHDGNLPRCPCCRGGTEPSVPHPSTPGAIALGVLRIPLCPFLQFVRYFRGWASARYGDIFLLGWERLADLQHCGGTCVVGCSWHFVPALRGRAVLLTCCYFAVFWWIFLQTASLCRQFTLCRCNALAATFLCCNYCRQLSTIITAQKGNSKSITRTESELPTERSRLQKNPPKNSKITVS